MKTKILNIYMTLLIVILLLAISAFTLKPDINEPIDLEIYTTTEIFYVNGLTVTSENDEALVYRFKNMKELKEYITSVTLSYNKEAYDCLMESDSLKRINK